MDDLMINEPNYEEVDFCRLTNVGENLLHDFGVETAQLRPEHYFIPWITIDNVRISSQLSHFIPYFFSFISVAQIFKHEIFTWDQAFSWSLRKKNAEKCKND